MNVRRKNGEHEPATFSSFQRNIQRYLSEKKYPFNILKDNEFEKSRRVLAAKHKSLVHEHDRRNKLQAAQADDENEDALFEAGEFGDSNPVTLQRTVWWFLSLHFGFRARGESDEDDWLNAATFKVEYDFHSNLSLIRTLWCASKFSGIDETLLWVSKTNRSCYDFRQIPLQIVLEVFSMITCKRSVNLFSNSWYRSLFFLGCSRHQKHVTRKPFEFKWPEVRF